VVRFKTNLDGTNTSDVYVSEFPNIVPWLAIGIDIELPFTLFTPNLTPVSLYYHHHHIITLLYIFLTFFCYVLVHLALYIIWMAG
jgi:hypothetical protein